MKKEQNRHYQQFMDTLEYRWDIKLTDSQKHALVMELETLVDQAFDSYWRNTQDAYRKSRQEFRRTF
jgi:hypothetical protein